MARGNYTDGFEGELHGAKRLVRVAVGAIVTLALISVVAMVLLVWPYSPLEPKRLLIPQVVCSGQVVTAKVEYELKEDVHNVEATPVWIALDVPGVPEGFAQETEGGTIPGRYFREGAHTLESPILRISPQREGRWLAKSTYEVHGSGPLGVPRTQRVEVYEEIPTLVLEAPECEEARVE